MKKAEKTAICRVFHDLIKADTIIDAGEMRCYTLMKEKYGISKDSVSSTAAFVGKEETVFPVSRHLSGRKKQCFQHRRFCRGRKKQCFQYRRICWEGRNSVSNAATFVSIESRIENTPNNKYHNGTKASLHRLD